MWTKILFLLMIYFVILAADAPKVMKSPPKERIAYISIMLLGVYLSVDFVLEKHWPDLNTIIDYIFKPPSDQIVKFFKPSS
ncbi:hypothetical protein KIH86_10385 [Paenibacillus sp. HN-1]|uniref:hypothetical protein n=1 Tax=Paenibacillus TaxID=44249 RepID=UPI001CA85C27|nr:MULTISPECIES: hypothetical protein [Paenibacillus]MBY9077937.1 hypothetical protein [Paenibacillus sp. CGMCC 1.18879]MBY9084639.1 hypothetical protein [Paenibacillus sinensis]